MSRRPAPCRLFAIFAADAPVAAILRRGPSAWVQLVRWDTRRDVFSDGSWFRGRIYEEKCDVSPDGRLFLYACHQGRRLGTSYTDSWTAVSRLPYLHALALWPVGTTYGGGGRFVGARQLVLRFRGPAPHPDHPAHGLSWTADAAPVHRSTEEVAGASFSARDQRGRVVFARDGVLFRRVRSRDVELCDFNAREPDPAPPPAWATRPLARQR